MARLFISDLHLNPQQPKVLEGFLRFLGQHAQDAEELFILGDFFDAWIGDDEDSAFAEGIKNALRAYTEDKHKLWLLRGNRDFLLGHKFAEEVGCTLLDDETRLEIAGQPTLLMHGDSLCTDDTAYMQFRQMVRNPAWQAQVLAAPLAVRRTMAQELRAKSQSLNAIKAEDIMDVAQASVEAVLQTHQVQQLIHGHTHRPAQHQFTLAGKTATRWVLGDWHDTGWYLRDDGKLALIEFAL